MHFFPTANSVQIIPYPLDTQLEIRTSQDGTFVFFEAKELALINVSEKYAETWAEGFFTALAAQQHSVDAKVSDLIADLVPALQKLNS